MGWKYKTLYIFDNMCKKHNKLRIIYENTININPRQNLKK